MSPSTTTSEADASYREDTSGIFVSKDPVIHREEEYDPEGFDNLVAMQSEHFWYLGRHRFLFHALMAALRSRPQGRAELRAVDLGGGCGGWIKYLRDHSPDTFAELGLADSSLRGLELAEPVVGRDVKRYQVDLLRLRWKERWDVVFLLDVVEHIAEDVEVLSQVRESLRPGGLLFVTTPALRAFWTYQDEIAHHVRRYSRRDLRSLADQSGLELCYSRYFMFFLSPLLLLSRMKAPRLEEMSYREIRGHHARTRARPATPINRMLHLIFAMESPLGRWIPFPWGTSVLGVFRKPS